MTGYGCGGVLGNNGKRETSASDEFTFNPHAAGLTGGNEVVEDAIDDFLVEGRDIPIRREIKFQGLGFDALLIRNILKVNLGEVRLAGYRTQGSKFWRVDTNPVIAFWESVRESLEFGFSGRIGKGSVRVAEQSQAGIFLLRSALHYWW